MTTTLPEIDVDVDLDAEVACEAVFRGQNCGMKAVALGVARCGNHTYAKPLCERCVREAVELAAGGLILCGSVCWRDITITAEPL